MDKNANQFETVNFKEVKQAFGGETVIQQHYEIVVKYKEELGSLNALINCKTKLAKLLNKDVNKLILSDISIKLILDNFIRSCEASSIELGTFDQLQKTEDNKVKLGSDNDFIKICKFMYQMVMNKKNATGNKNMEESIEFVFGVTGNYYFRYFYNWLAGINLFHYYINNIQHITCEDADFNNFKKLINEFQIEFDFAILNGDYNGFFNIKSKSIPKGKRMLGKLEENSWLLIALDIMTCIGFIVSAFFAINYFWLGFIEMSSAAAIASMAVPGVVALLCLGICIFLLKTRKSLNTKIPHQIGNIKLKSGEIVNRYGQEYPKDNIEINLNNSIENNTLQ